MASKYSSYSTMRDIAVKRAARLSGSGLAPSIHIPTVKELKAAGISASAATKSLQAYLQAPTTVREFKRIEELNRPVFITDRKGPVITTREQQKREEQLIRQRERNRRYRERVRNLSKQEKSYMKAAKTLGLNIPPRLAKAFGEYLDFRFAMGSDKIHYRIARYVEDIQSIIEKKGYSFLETALDFFGTYLRDRAELEERSGEMLGYTPEELDLSWEEIKDM